MGGDTRNYIHNRAACTGKTAIEVVKDVNNESIESAQRVETILKGRGKYEQSWNDSVRGYMAMHTTNPRYKLTDLGLGEQHPLAPFEQQIGQFFERMGTQ